MLMVAIFANKPSLVFIPTILGTPAELLGITNSLVAPAATILSKDAPLAAVTTEVA